MMKQLTIQEYSEKYPTSTVVEYLEYLKQIEIKKENPKIKQFEKYVGEYVILNLNNSDYLMMFEVKENYFKFDYSPTIKCLCYTNYEHDLLQINHEIIALYDLHHAMDEKYGCSIKIIKKEFYDELMTELLKFSEKINKIIFDYGNR